MKGEIVGNFLPVLNCTLEKGDQLFTEAGGMSWMTEGITMETNTNGGIMKGLGRAFSGESLFMNTYTAEKDNTQISFASSFPGEILEFDLSNGESIICQKKSFMCAEKFIMQKITGPGKAYLELDGNIVKKELAAGETLKVDNGYVAAMTEGVQLDITTVKGVKNVLFGGEGLFLTTLQGPGTVWLQSMPISKLAGTIYPYLPASSK